MSTVFSNPDSLNLKKNCVTKIVFLNVSLVHVGMIGETVARVSRPAIIPVQKFLIVGVKKILFYFAALFSLCFFDTYWYK